MIKQPSPATLKKYGLSLEEWMCILDSQGGVCPICKKVPSTGRFVVDHEHVKDWKDMSAELRKTYVRGVICWFCNYNYLARTITIEKAKNLVAYLEGYQTRHAG